MQQITTIRDLQRRDHQLHAYCHLCDRWRVLDIDGMVREGRGGFGPPIAVRCPDCGELGIVKVRPPRLGGPSHLKIAS